MSKSDTFEADVLKDEFQGTAFSWNADTVLYVALHSADPTDAGSESSNEVAYTGYARVAVNRTSGAWTISGTNPTTATNAADILFPKCTGGSATATYFSIGVASTGATEILHSGALTSSMSISTNITPRLAAGQVTITED